MSIVVFWVATSCGLLGSYQRFGGKYRHHLQGDASIIGLIYDILTFSQSEPILRV
jgi:hypothetical protein